MSKIILAVFLFLTALAAAYVFMSDRQTRDYESGARSQAEQSSGLVVGKNAIYVADQPPSSEIAIEFALFSEPGFVVVHESRNDEPGEILGASGFVAAGKISDLRIPLSRETQNGETVFAMLHKDDGDGIFNPAKDAPVTEAGGEPVMTLFAVDVSAEPPGAVSL